jgi:ribosome-binding protein aMBF1 (putative translation factor)
MAARIREIRQAKGLSQWELAQRTGIHPTNLYKIENGHLRLYDGWRRRIAEALGVREEELKD